MSDEVADVLTEAESDFPATVTIDGTDYACRVSSRSKTRNLEAGGFGIEADLTVTVRCSLFDTEPAAQTALTHDSNSYTIDRVAKAPGGSHYRLFCVSASRGV